MNELPDAVRRRFRAVTFDLDDTLWPIAPVIERAEATLQTWFEQRHPEVACRWSVDSLRELREAVVRDHADRAHDYSFLRRTVLERVMSASGLGQGEAEAAYQVFLAARNQVVMYEDALPVLEALSECFALACISNGNACVDTIGIGSFFAVRVHAREAGMPKPDPRIFALAAEELGLSTTEIVHVGDCLHADVWGALGAGMAAVWLDRCGSHRSPPEGVERIESLDQLPAALERLAAT